MSMLRRQFLGFLTPLMGLLLGRRALAAPAPDRGKVVGILQVIFPEGNDPDWRVNVEHTWLKGAPYMYIQAVPDYWSQEQYEGAFVDPRCTLALVRMDKKGRISLDTIRGMDEAWKNRQEAANK